MHEYTFICEYKSLIIFNIRDIIPPGKHVLYKNRPSTFNTDKIATKKFFSEQHESESQSTLVQP